MHYIDEVNQKRQAQSEKKQLDMLVKAVTTRIPAMQPVNLDKQITRMGDRIVSAIEASKTDTAIEGVREAQQSQADRIVEALDSLKKAVTEQKPVVASSTTSQQAVDFEPIVNAIKQLERLLESSPKQALDLSSYRAHDLDNGPDGVQYIGFSDANGSWYIMQHDPDNNRDRYYFGAGDYDAAWDDKYSHSYNILSEALSALRS